MPDNFQLNQKFFVATHVTFSWEFADFFSLPIGYLNLDISNSLPCLTFLSFNYFVSWRPTYNQMIW